MKKKTHFDYFGVNTDIFELKEIQEMIHNKGAISIAVLMYIKSKIFGVGGQGSYLAFDRNIGVRIASATLNLKEESISEIINYACNRGLFDKGIYTRYEVLTSAQIQLEYIDLCKRTKRDEQLREELPYDLIGYNEQLQKTKKDKADVPNPTPTVEPQYEKVVAKKPNIDYRAFAKAYNDNCGNATKVTKLTESRKRSINALFTEFTQEDLVKVFTEINKSNFLQGSNKQGWKMTFDWFIKKSNFIKILDGNYRNKVSDEKFNQTTNPRGNNGKSISTEYIEGVLRDLQY